MTVEHRLRIGEREVLLVEGPAGWGECSPLAGYPCDPARARAAALEAATLGWPAPRRTVVPVNAFLAADAPIEPAALAGFPAIKVKVGRAAPDVDVRRLRALRDAVGPGPAIRIDANGAWDVPTAIEVLRAVEPLHLEFVEQPVTSIDDLAEVRRRTAVPIAADECVRSVDDARRVRALGAADLVVLKVQPLGGVRPALEVAAAAGLPAVVSSMLETSVGLAAGVALAAALDELPFACGLATLGEVAGDVTDEPLLPVDGHVPVRSVVPSAAALAAYGARS
ncbi:MAG: enolase C-terminal domain-like protein [Actinomycetes bacterium]